MNITGQAAREAQIPINAQLYLYNFNDNTVTQIHTKHKNKNKQNYYTKLAGVHLETKTHINNITHSIGCININVKNCRFVTTCKAHN